MPRVLGHPYDKVTDQTLHCLCRLQRITNDEDSMLAELRSALREQNTRDRAHGFPRSLGAVLHCSENALREDLASLTGVSPNASLGHLELAEEIWRHYQKQQLPTLLTPIPNTSSAGGQSYLPKRSHSF